LNRPAETARRFIRMPNDGAAAFRTGDLGSFTRLHGIQYQGRADLQVKVRGVRVELEEIEACFATVLKAFHVLDGIVVVNVDEGLGLVGMCVMHENMKRLVVASETPSFDSLSLSLSLSASVSSSSSSSLLGMDKRHNRHVCSLVVELLRCVAEENLPLHMRPNFFCIESFPIGRTGKIDRNELCTLARLMGHSSELDDFNEPDTFENDGMAGWLDLVSTAWIQALGLPHERLRLSSKSNFLYLGGDSLKAVRAIKILTSLLKTRKLLDEKVEGENEKGDGVFGELLPSALQPQQLMNRPFLLDYVNYLKQSLNLELSASASPSTELSSSKPSSSCSLLSQFPSSLKERYHSLLLNACGAGLDPLVSFLLSNKLTLSILKSVPPNSTTPLHAAAKNDRVHIAKLLLTTSLFSPTTPDASGATSLHLASQNSTPAMLKTLLEAMDLMPSLDPTTSKSTLKLKPSKKVGTHAGKRKSKKTNLVGCSTDHHSQTCLHHAARFGAGKAVVSLLLQVLPQTALNQPDAFGRTPLHWATVNGHRTTVSMLLEVGADVRVKDEAHETALQIAERRARCGAAERGGGVRPSVFGDIATLLGGRADTENVKKYIK
jgi:ankyrin repeat protein